MSCDDACECSFSDAWGSPEDHGGDFVAVDDSAEDFAGGDEVFLSCEVVEGFGADSCG